MAEGDENEKTEDPTHKRLDEARERGDVAKSQEVNTWFVLAGATLVLASFAGSMSSTLTATMRGLVANAHQLPVDGRGLVGLSSKIGFEIAAAIAIPILLLVLAAIAGNMIQHRLIFSADPIKPKFSKVSPAAGVKRLFSKHALVNFAKGLVKLVLIGAIMSALLWPERHRLASTASTDVAALLPLISTLALKMLGAVVAVMALIAALDFFYQYWTWYERQKMSLREIKEEYKQSEGDPHVKGKIKQLRAQRAKKRMMAAVPQASVVITNPTHYAIALQYEKGMNAPVCVAKGVDLIALKIREVAGAHDIPVVENPPLARALYATVEIDQEVPSEHYKAVAEVIGYVMRLRKAVR